MRSRLNVAGFDTIVLLALFAFGALLFASSFWIGGNNHGPDVGAGFAPRLFAGLLMLFCALGVIFGKPGADRRLGADAVVGFVVIVSIAYALALPVLGYTIATFVTLAVVLAALRAGSWWRIILFSLCMTAGLYLVFERVLVVGLPGGVLLPSVARLR